jgi:hypothetical protein
MTLKVRAPKDFFAGLLFVAIGALGAILASRYPYGSATRMGPGYLPMLLSCCTMALGLVVLVRSLAIEGEPVARPVWRPLVLILAAIVVFGLVIANGGLVLAVIASTIVGGLASRDMGWIELIALSIALAGFCALVFVYGLGQPIELWPH